MKRKFKIVLGLIIVFVVVTGVSYLLKPDIFKNKEEIIKVNINLRLEKR